MGNGFSASFRVALGRFFKFMRCSSGPLRPAILLNGGLRYKFLRYFLAEGLRLRHGLQSLKTSSCVKVELTMRIWLSGPSFPSEESPVLRERGARFRAISLFCSIQQSRISSSIICHHYTRIPMNQGIQRPNRNRDQNVRRASKDKSKKLLRLS